MTYQKRLNELYNTLFASVILKPAIIGEKVNTPSLKDSPLNHSGT